MAQKEPGIEYADYDWPPNPDFDHFFHPHNSGQQWCTVECVHTIIARLSMIVSDCLRHITKINHLDML